MNEVTIKTLAAHLNLSVATVSKALRDSHEISPSTKEKVCSLARELHFTPNPYASSLRRKKSNTIGIVIPEVADSFFSQAIKGIEAVAQEKGYHVLVYLTYEHFLREESILKDYISGRVDGVLMSVSSETSVSTHVHELKNKNIPIVFFDRALENVDTAKVVTDDLESSFKATQHLIRRGCKRIAFLSISRSLSINNKRTEGYLNALQAHNMPASLSDIVWCSNDNKSNYTVLYKMLQQDNCPDGIIASVEKLVTPVYTACKDLKIPIPGKVKVISFSNLDAASILNPSLTTVVQPAFEMGKRAAAILFNAIEKKNYILKNEEIVIPSTLIIRDSTS